MDLQRTGLDEVVRQFEQLEDPRSTGNRQHPLTRVVVIAVMAILAGAAGPTAIAEWAATKQEFLRGSLPLPNGIPRKDVFRRVLMALKPAAFQACFVNWLQSLRARAAAATGVEQPVLAVDGKSARRSHDRKHGLGAFHSVSRVGCVESSKTYRSSSVYSAAAPGEPSRRLRWPPTARERPGAPSPAPRPDGPDA